MFVSVASLMTQNYSSLTSIKLKHLFWKCHFSWGNIVRALPNLVLAELSSGNPRLACPGATGQERGGLAELDLGNLGLGE